MTTPARSAESTRSTGRKRQASRQSGNSQTRESRSQSRQSTRRTKQSETSSRTQSARASQGSRASQASTTTRSSTSAQSSGRGQSAGQSHGTTVELPFVTANVRTPEVSLPGREQLTSATNALRSQLPSRDRALFYGALGLSAAFAVIDWPVALAIGVGTALVSRDSTSESSSDSSSE